MDEKSKQKFIDIWMKFVIKIIKKIKAGAATTDIQMTLDKNATLNIKTLG